MHFVLSSALVTPNIQCVKFHIWSWKWRNRQSRVISKRCCYVFGRCHEIFIAYAFDIEAGANKEWCWWFTGSSEALTAMEASNALAFKPNVLRNLGYCVLKVNGTRTYTYSLKGAKRRNSYVCFHRINIKWKLIKASGEPGRSSKLLLKFRLKNLKFCLFTDIFNRRPSVDEIRNVRVLTVWQYVYLNIL